MTGGSPALDMQFVSEDDEMLFIGIQMEDQLWSAAWVMRPDPAL